MLYSWLLLQVEVAKLYRFEDCKLKAESSGDITLRMKQVLSLPLTDMMLPTSGKPSAHVCPLGKPKETTYLAWKDMATFE